jgi:hypothetical protein
MLYFLASFWHLISEDDNFLASPREGRGTGQRLDLGLGLGLGLIGDNGPQTP